MDPVRDLPQLIEYCRQPLGDSRQRAVELTEPWGDTRPRRLQVETQRYETLLGAVVKITLDPPSRLVASSHDASARGHQLGATMCVRDGGFHQLGESREPLLGVSRQRLGAIASDADDAPHGALDKDWHA